MTATGTTVAQIAAKGMTKALTRTEQKAVCASALNQRELEASHAKVMRSFRRLGKLITDCAPPDKIVNALWKHGKLLEPDKPQ